MQLRINVRSHAAIHPHTSTHQHTTASQVDTDFDGKPDYLDDDDDDDGIPDNSDHDRNGDGILDKFQDKDGVDNFLNSFFYSIKFGQMLKRLFPVLLKSSALHKLFDWTKSFWF